MASQAHESLVVEVLRTGPADGQHILEQAKGNNIWEHLYLASRSSPYAVAWREAFGRRHLTQTGVQSILELAILELRLQSETPLDNGENAQTAVFTAKLIANCCADNDHNRRISIKAGALLPLMNLLIRGADPNILVPTIYNVCCDLEDPAEHMVAGFQSSEGITPPTLAEERLATTDGSAKSLLSGIFMFLSPPVVLGCNDEIKEYLADIVEMAARPSAFGDFVSRTALGNAFDRLLSPDGGKLLAGHSAKCCISITRAILAVANTGATKAFLASSGAVFDIALMVDIPHNSEDYYGEGEEEREENLEALEGLKTATLKLLYEVCQLPQFSAPPKYGIARQSLDIIRNFPDSSSFIRAAAYIMLYGFVDSNARAHLLASEDLIPSVLRTLQYEIDKTVLHPALGLATKLAVTWSLRTELYKGNAMQAVQHLLTAANLGYEIPLNTVTFLELLTKGHPEHVKSMLTDLGTGRSLMEDLFALFDKGHDAICFEIGRLFIEICATLVQQNPSEAMSNNFELNTFLAACNQQAVSRTLIFMGTKGQSADAAAAQRVWFALGLLSTTEQGKQVVLLALQDANLQQKVRTLNQEVESWSGGNIKFMLHNLGKTINQICPAPADDLDTAMSRITLG